MLDIKNSVVDNIFLVLLRYRLSSTSVEEIMSVLLPLCDDTNYNVGFISCCIIVLSFTTCCKAGSSIWYRWIGGPSI